MSTPEWILIAWLVAIIIFTIYEAIKVRSVKEESKSQVQTMECCFPMGRELGASTPDYYKWSPDENRILININPLNDWYPEVIIGENSVDVDVNLRDLEIKGLDNYAFYVDGGVLWCKFFFNYPGDQEFQLVHNGDNDACVLGDFYIYSVEDNEVMCMGNIGPIGVIIPITVLDK